MAAWSGEAYSPSRANAGRIAVSFHPRRLAYAAMGTRGVQANAFRRSTTVVRHSDFIRHLGSAAAAPFDDVCRLGPTGTASQRPATRQGHDVNALSGSAGNRGIDSRRQANTLVNTLMAEPAVISGPAFPPERFAERLAEAIRLANEPGEFAALPSWTRRVMLILKEQLVPPELAAMFTAEQAIVAEGVCIAWMAHAREAMTDPGEGEFAQRVAKWMTPQTTAVVDQLRDGRIAESPEFRGHIMRRLFADSAAERRAFTEGLALGNRVYDLFSQHAEQCSTDATRVYLLLWLYWPEIAQLGSIAEAAEAIERLLGANRNLIGRNWEERFRKIANRIGLSYRAKQARSKRITPRRRTASGS